MQAKKVNEKFQANRCLNNNGARWILSTKYWFTAIAIDKWVVEEKKNMLKLKLHAVLPEYCETSVFIFIFNFHQIIIRRIVLHFRWTRLVKYNVVQYIKILVVSIHDQAETKLFGYLNLFASKGSSSWPHSLVVKLIHLFYICLIGHVTTTNCLVSIWNLVEIHAESLEPILSKWGNVRSFCLYGEYLDALAVHVPLYISADCMYA